MQKDYLFITGVPDAQDAFVRFTRTFQMYEPKKPKEWMYHDVDWRVVSVSTYISKQENKWWRCVLSEEGNVGFMNDPNSFNEKITGAGVHSEDSVGWGYLSDLQQIGTSLYASGYRGQVYKRTGANQWIHMDAGLLQAPDTPLEQSVDISVINGANENAIYAAGFRHEAGLTPVAYFWNGALWRQLELPPVAERITNMFVENEERIWMCGRNGTLLVGNANDGFNSLSEIEDNQLFYSVCKYQEKIYLGSNVGLFVYDPADPDEGITEVRTKLRPDLQDANIVDCAQGVLWSIGSKDIAKFDGKTWTRIDHPDNPPIRD
ncbi:MAG: hypothetical protein ACRCWJ_09695 [Casimicrobium sp.]